jgi:hypothetical protein
MSTPFPEVLLSDEITGSIRQTKTSNNIVSDQFLRFQSRHLIETRKKVK